MSTPLRSRWLAWQPREASEAPMPGTVKTVKTSIEGTSVGFEGSVPEGVAPTLPGGLLDIADCMVLIRKTFEGLEAEYESGALSVLDSNQDLRRRFDATEARIDELAKVPGGPTEYDFCRALAEHAAVWRELIARYRARQERGADRMPDLPEDTGRVGKPKGGQGRADPMPDLPENTALAIGISYGDGERGTWDVIREGRR